MAGQTVEPRKGREGARWVNQAPTGEEFAAWFAENVPLDDKLKHEHYVGGIVMIPAVDEKAKIVDGFSASGSPIIVQRPVMYYIPYAKVETRIQYFWDLMAAHSAEWVGTIQPIVTERPETNQLATTVTGTDGEETATYRTASSAAIVEQLPPGFFLLPVPLGSAYTHFLCCSYRVAVYHVDDKAREWPIREGRGTKMVPLLLGRNDKYPDVNAIMKAETGAVGRAIGFAGIFNIPGSGVATAEDMLEALSQERVAPSDASTDQVVAEGGSGPAAPADAAPAGSSVERAEEDDAALQARVLTMAATLRDDHPQEWTAFGRWCHQRRPAITTLTQKGPALRGLARKLEKSLVEAEQTQAAGAVADALADGAAEPQEPAPALQEPEDPGTPAPVEGGA